MILILFTFLPFVWLVCKIYIQLLKYLQQWQTQPWDIQYFHRNFYKTFVVCNVIYFTYKEYYVHCQSHLVDKFHINECY